MRRWVACVLVGLATGCLGLPTPENIYFGVGTDFYGGDFTVMSWGNTLQFNFAATCAGSYTVDRGVARLTTEYPRNCVPDCFDRGMSVEVAHGVMHLTPHTKRCYAEAARVRVARFVNESTAHYIRDTDVMYFETHAV